MNKPRLAGGVILGIAIGLAVGVGAYTFVYARGYSYMTDNAEACVICHVMQDQFSARRCSTSIARARRVTSGLRMSCGRG